MKRLLAPAIGLVLGAISGYVYYRFWGCTNGCPLKSSAPLMTAYGGILGAVLLSTISDLILQRKKREPTEEPGSLQ